MPAPKNNQYAIGNSGRAKKYKSAEEVEEVIQIYFDECDNNTKEVYDKKNQEVTTVAFPLPYTVEGLALALDFTSREALINYEKKKGYEEFFDTIKKAKLRIQQNKVVNGIAGTYNQAVTIFDLKNNHGYKDKNETDITSGGDKIELPQIYLPDNGRNPKTD
ncbi:MAG: hypothetical protein GY861_19205 [bacterium]|nr:hypothetical protein [bacterium]